MGKAEPAHTGAAEGTKADSAERPSRDKSEALRGFAGWSRRAASHEHTFEGGGITRTGCPKGTGRIIPTPSTGDRRSGSAGAKFRARARPRSNRQTKGRIGTVHASPTTPNLLIMKYYSPVSFPPECCTPPPRLFSMNYTYISPYNIYHYLPIDRAGLLAISLYNNHKSEAYIFQIPVLQFIYLQISNIFRSWGK